MRPRALAATAVLFGGLAIPALSSTSGLASLGAAPVPQASPHWADGRFHNEEPTGMMKEGSASVLGQFLWSDTLRSPTCPLPLVKPTLSPPPASGLRLTWLGHSSTLIELDGVTVLTDPQWSQRASPSTLVSHSVSWRWVSRLASSSPKSDQGWPMPS